jgi:hypothetical protein
VDGVQQVRIAIAAMIPMMATTISSSIRVKPRSFLAVAILLSNSTEP